MRFVLKHSLTNRRKSTWVFLLSAPDEVVEHVADERVLQGQVVTEHSGVAVHQHPGFTPEQELNRGRTNTGSSSTGSCLTQVHACKCLLTADQPLILWKQITINTIEVLRNFGLADRVARPTLGHGTKHLMVILHRHITRRLARDGLLKVPPDRLAVKPEYR